MDNRINTNLIEANTKLIDENKILKEDKEILQRRIDKAIEQLEELKNLYDDNYTVSDKSENIINILKGEYIYE